MIEDIDLMYCAPTSTTLNAVNDAKMNVEGGKPIEIVIRNGKKEYGLNDKMDEFTQYSNDDESTKTLEAKDMGDDVSDSNSYEEKVKRCSESDLPYKVDRREQNDGDKDEDEYEIAKIRQVIRNHIFKHVKFVKGEGSRPGAKRDIQKKNSKI